MTQFNPNDDAGTKDLISKRDVILEADSDQDGAGDIILRTGGVERARISASGTGTGWGTVLGGSLPVLDVVETFGAKGDWNGSTGTDDTAALQDALNAVPSTGAILSLNRGSGKGFYVPNGGLSCNNPVYILGSGPGTSPLGVGSPYWLDGLSQIVVDDGTATALTLNSSRSRAEGFSLICTDNVVSGGVGIKVPSGIAGAGAGNGNRFVDVAVYGFDTGIDIRDGREWFIDRCFIYAYGTYGIQVREASYVDDGDWALTNSLIYGSSRHPNPKAGLLFATGAAGRVIGNKFNFRGVAADYGDHCIELAVEDLGGVSTGELYIAGNGISSAKTACVRLHTNGTITGSFSGITITGNSITSQSTTGTQIQADPSATSVIADIAIAGNNLKNSSASTYPISLTNVANVAIAGNNYYGPSPSCKLSVAGGGVTGLMVAPGDLAGVGATADQPASNTSGNGSFFFDTTLNQPAFNIPNTLGIWFVPDGTRNHGPTYSTSITPVWNQGRWQPIVVTDGNAFTINSPSGPSLSGRTAELTIEISNTSGGAMGVITWNAAYVFNGFTWTNPATGKKRFARFEWNGSKWVCTAVSGADY